MINNKIKGGITIISPDADMILGMWGPLPPERIKGGDLASTGRIEIAQEDSNTKYKRQ